LKLKGETYSFILNKINVNSITSNSGVFIGFNRSPYWHVQAKQNNGFGAASGGVFLGNTQIIIDNDLIDAPIDDRDLVMNCAIEDEKKKREPIQKESITLINFHSVNVNALNSNSTVAIGENDQPNWGSHNKSNYGSGTLSGKNLSGKNLSIIHDDDLIDVTMSDHRTINTNGEDQKIGETQNDESEETAITDENITDQPS
jgi:hypothetical protein